MDEKRTLYIGFYDYSYGKSACQIIEGKISPVQLTEKQFEAIHEYVISKDWGWDFKDTDEEKYNFDFLEPYDIIIVCDDSEYTYIDIKKELK